jgi:uncharacterized repeat protein (TIGR01451 family)
VPLQKILQIPGIQKVLGAELKLLVEAEAAAVAEGLAARAAATAARRVALGSAIAEGVAFEAGYRFGHWAFDRFQWKQDWDDWVFSHLPKGVQDFVAPNAPDAHTHDPNAAIGPGGFGTNGYIADAGQALPYTIDFENAPTATAPVQRATITDQLDPNLNWNTFQFTQVGFGDTIITVPADDGQFFQTTVPMTENGETFDVDIQLSLNPATGLVTATLQSLNPITDLPPDALNGFLPPEDGTGRGMGFFSYLVALKPGLATGTQIRNVASVTFDINPPLATDLVDDNNPSQGIDPTKEDLNTIDATVPTSSVGPLPAVTTTTSFTVSWSGSDAGGSGVGLYDILVSDDGGPFVPYLSGTTATSAQFPGVAGHTYAFYSVATSNVGNRQPTPTIAQATTFVAGPPSSAVNPLPATSASQSFTVSWSGSPGSGASSIASYSIYESDDGGPFTPFLTNTMSTSALFAGQFGHTYRFFSVATNNLGIVQPAPFAAQATIAVSLPPPVTVAHVADVLKKKLVNEVIITFSGGVNATEAALTGIYRLATPGKKGSYTAKNAGIIKLKQAVYNPIKDTVTLTPKKPFALTKPVQVLVNGTPPSGLRDTFGQFLGGGTNAIAILSKGKVTLEPAARSAADVRSALELAAFDAVLDRAAEIGSGHSVHDTETRHADLAVVHHRARWHVDH